MSDNIGASEILIGLGANLPSQYGTPAETLLEAQAVLEKEGIKILKASSIWLTAPVPVTDTHPWYANRVLSIQTDLYPMPLLMKLLEIETRFGRVRSYQNAPRVLDLDVIAYKHEISDDKDLILPHPRMHERAFVLRPMAEILDYWKHPESQKTLSELVESLDEEQKVRCLKDGEEYRLAG